MISKVTVDVKGLAPKLHNAADFAQFVVDEAVLKDSNYYIPKDRGDLEESGITHSKIGEGSVSWMTPYSRRLYYNPQYEFSKDKNPNARGLWFEASKSEKRDAWIKQGEKAMKGRL